MIPIFESHILEIFVFSIIQNKISEEDLHRNWTYSIVIPCKIMVCIYTSTFYNIEV